MAFATLPTELRTEGSGLYNLMRNIGSAFGVSIAASQLAELTQINHGYLSEFMTPFRHLPSMPGMSGAAAMRMLNLSITQQAGMLAYVNVFWLLGVLCIAIIPLAFLLRPPPKIPQGSQVAAE
jgi:DHA2 family multidrug resistance protein